MKQLNVLPPSIEPHATGHIIEQIQLVQQILDAGYAYVSKRIGLFRRGEIRPRFPLRRAVGT